MTAPRSRFVIYRESTGEWAGFRFPGRTVTERPDAREFPTRASAEAALRGAKAHADNFAAMLGFDVVEDL